MYLCRFCYVQVVSLILLIKFRPNFVFVLFVVLRSLHDSTIPVLTPKHHENVLQRKL